MDQLPTIMGALVLAAVLWVVKETRDNGTALAVVQSQIRDIVLPALERSRNQEAEVDVLDLRVDQVERDVVKLWKGLERRSGVERREAGA